MVCKNSLALKLDGGIDKLQAPVTAIGKKLNEDMARMAEEASRNRDLLRQSIETKLDTASQRNEESARALREELTGHFGITTHLLSDTLKGFGDNQHQRLGEMKQQIGEMSEKQATTGEALRQTVEARLDILRQENSTKLDEMRQTVDEKSQTTLDKRLMKSFKLCKCSLKVCTKGWAKCRTWQLELAISNVC